MTTLCVLAVLATPLWLAWCRFGDGPTPDNSLSIEGAISLARGDGYVRHWFTRGDKILSAPGTRHISEFPPGVSVILLPFVGLGLNGNTVLKSLEMATILLGGIFWVRYLQQQALSLLFSCASRHSSASIALRIGLEPHSQTRSFGQPFQCGFPSGRGS